MIRLLHQDAAVSGTGEQGRCRSQDKHARQEELRMLVNNYDDMYGRLHQLCCCILPVKHIIFN